MSIIFALVTAFCGGAASAAGYFLLRPARGGHEHSWRLVATQPSKALDGPRVARTVLLWECRACPDAAWTRGEGTWLDDTVEMLAVPDAIAG